MRIIHFHAKGYRAFGGKCHVKLIKREDIQYEITDMSVDTVFVLKRFH